MIGKMASIIMRRPRAAPAREPSPPPTPRDAFFELVERVARQERLPHHLAMAKVRAERPADFRAAFPPPRRAHPRDGARRAVAHRSQLLDKVSEISQRDRVPDHVAMARIRSEHPELVAAYY